MRNFVLGGAAAAAMLSIGLASSAEAQMRTGGHGAAGYPAPMSHPMPRPATRPFPHPVRPGPYGHRWGSTVGGHWWGGVNAPGGWSAYRRPVRGWVLPSYWIAPRFFITDWASYGLAQPPVGYNWARYYDDAVLIDAHGSVYDSVSGLDWDGYGDAYEGEEADAPPPVGYHPPHHPPRMLHYAYGPSSWTSPDGATTVVTTSTGGPYGAGTTTVTVQVQPVTTTTTTTVYEDAVTYSRPVAHKVYRKRWAARPRCGCR